MQQHRTPLAQQRSRLPKFRIRCLPGPGLAAAKLIACPCQDALFLLLHDYYMAPQSWWLVWWYKGSQLVLPRIFLLVTRIMFILFLVPFVLS